MGEWWIDGRWDLGRKCFFLGRDNVFEGVAVRCGAAICFLLWLLVPEGCLAYFYFMLCKCVRGTGQAV